MKEGGLSLDLLLSLELVLLESSLEPAARSQ